MSTYIIYATLPQVTWYLMISVSMRANIHHIRPSFLGSPCLRWQETARCIISEPQTSAKLIFSSKCLHLFSWHRLHQCLFRMCGVSSWWLALVSPQRLWTAVRKPPHLLTWCMFMCQSCHLPLLLIPSRGNVVTPPASQTPLESKRVSARTCIYKHEGERNVIYPPQVVRSCVGFLHVLGSVSISHTRVSEGWYVSHHALCSLRGKCSCVAVGVPGFFFFFSSN